MRMPSISEFEIHEAVIRIRETLKFHLHFWGRYCFAKKIEQQSLLFQEANVENNRSACDDNHLTSSERSVSRSFSSIFSV